MQNDWTARIPSVLGLLLLALTGWWAGHSLGGPQVAWALALSLLLSASMFEKARLAEIESLYVSLAGTGILLWMTAWARQASVSRQWLLTVLPFSLANLTKDPVYLIFFYSVVIIALRHSGRLRDLVHPMHLLSAMLALAPMIYWGYLVQHQIGELPAFPSTTDDAASALLRNPSDVWWQQIGGRPTYQNIDAADWLSLPFRVLFMFVPWPLFACWLAWRPAPARPAEPAPQRTRMGEASMVPQPFIIMLEGD